MKYKNKLAFIIGSVLAVLWIVAVYFFTKNNLIAGLSSLLLPLPVLFIYKVFAKPRIGFVVVLILNYIAIGLSRYFTAPVGLTVDIMLFFTWVTFLFSQFNVKVDWKEAGRDYTWFVMVWFVMTFMQLFNPEALSREAWFYAMRGQALYIFLAVPLVYLLFNKPKDMEFLIKLTAWLTLLAVAKGLMQKYVGVDRWEQMWLNEPGNGRTHILFGQLRVFSFFSDAGTFGSSMGYFGIIYVILGIHIKNKRLRYFYLFVGLAALYAMFISGTRSAIAVPLTGFTMYTILTKKIKIMVSMGVIVFVIFVFLKYTTIGQGNYDIRRMRSAFDGNDASLNVRTENRILFGNYLRTRPFGGGIGSSGNWGLRFTPNTFLAQTATDGWYIQLWAEQGIVGLSFYLIMIFFIVFKSTFLIFYRLKKPENIIKAIAFTAGMYGLMVSSYSASSLGQMPNSILVFVTMTMISLMPKWEREEQALVEQNSKLHEAN